MELVMKTVSYISSVKAGKRYNRSNPITDALHVFGKPELHEGIEPVEEEHIGVCFGSYTQRKLDTERAILIQNLEKSKHPIFYIDSAAFSTYIRNFLNSNQTQMFRIGLGSCTGTGKFWNYDLPSDRYEALKKTFKFTEKDPVKNEDGPIVFLMQSERGFMYDSLEPYHKFVQETCKKIREQTDRKIVLRLHPNPDPRNNIVQFTKGLDNFEIHQCDDDRRTLFDSIQHAHSVVTHSSSGAMESVVEGIPTIALDDRCFGSGMYLNTLDNIEECFDNFQWEKRQQWLYNLAYTSWTTTEMGSDAVFSYYEAMTK